MRRTLRPGDIAMNYLVELMHHKRWVDGAYLELAKSATLARKPELQRELLYWLNHIHIVDQIFHCHLIGKAHGFSSTVSDEIPDANDLHERMLDLDGSLIALSERLPHMRRRAPSASSSPMAQTGR